MLKEFKSVLSYTNTKQMHIHGSIFQLQFAKFYFMELKYLHLMKKHILKKFELQRTYIY